MKPHAARGHRPGRASRRFVDDEAITPVIGSILILGISVLGISAIMFWGAPALQILQEQNAQAAMLGEFHEVRQNSLALTITDGSRLPRVNLGSGDLSVETGTRISVTAAYADPLDAALIPNCRMDLDDWSLADETQFQAQLVDCGQTRVANTVNGCPGNPTEAYCLRTYLVEGRKLTQIFAEANDVIGSGTGTLLVDLPQSFAVDSWVVRLESRDGLVTYAESWIIEYQALHWKLDGRTEPYLRLEAGALFSGYGENTFIEVDAPIAEQAFGTDELALRWPIMEGPEVGRSGTQSIVVFLRLEDNLLRIDDSVRAVQYDFEGDFARAWCTSLMLRDDDVDSGFAYKQPYTTRTCAGSTHPDSRYTIVFDKNDGADAFPFAFTHVQIAIET